MTKNFALALVLMSLLSACGDNNNTGVLPAELFLGSVSGNQDGVEACAEYFLTKKEDLAKREEVRASIDEGRNKISNNKCQKATVGTCTYDGEFAKTKTQIAVFVYSGNANEMKPECEKAKGTWR